MGRKRLNSSSILLLVFAAGSMHAAPVRWYLSGVRFADGGSASGSFVYDTDTNYYTNIDITTTPGGIFEGASYGTLYPIIPSASFFWAGGLSSPAIQLQFSTPLISGGGTIGLTNSQETWFLYVWTGQRLSRGVVAGSVTTTPPAPVLARPVTWYLNGVRFADGGEASGSFAYDADLNLYSSIAITTTPGSLLGAAYYSSALRATVGYLWATVPGVSGAAPGMQMWFARNLTNAGGTVDIVGTGSYEGCFTYRLCVPSGRTVVSGTVSTIAPSSSEAVGVPTLSAAGLVVLAICLASVTFIMSRGTYHTH